MSELMKRRYWLVYVPEHPNEVDGVVYQTFEEAIDVVRKSLDQVTPDIAQAWGAEIGPVEYTEAEYLTDTVEVDV